MTLCHASRVRAEFFPQCAKNHGEKRVPAEHADLRRNGRGIPHLQDKLKKKGASPKTWYRTFVQIATFEAVANQKDPVENERSRSLKFLQFLENFSGGYPWGEGDKKMHPVAATEVDMLKL